MLIVHRTALVIAKDVRWGPAETDRSWYESGPGLGGWQHADLQYAEDTAPSSTYVRQENLRMDVVDVEGVVLQRLVVLGLAPFPCNIFL